LLLAIALIFVLFAGGFSIKRSDLTPVFAPTMTLATSIGKLADLLGLSFKEKPKNKQKMELVTVHDTNYELIELFIDPDLFSSSASLASLELPSDVSVTMIARKDKIIAPRGNTVLKPGVILTILVEEDKIGSITESILARFETGTSKEAAHAAQLS